MGDGEQLRGFDQALTHIEEGILSGAYPLGSQLPTERTLAGELNVSRGAVREAIRALQAQGILVSGSGRGHGTRVRGEHVGAIGRILQLQLALRVLDIDDLTDTRVALERAAIRHAAHTRDAASLDRARTCYEAMCRARTPDEFNDLDTSFHEALAHSGGNRLLIDLAVAIRRSLARPIHIAETVVDDWEPLRLQLNAQHLAMLEAVCAGRGEEGERLVEDHIRFAWRHLGDALAALRLNGDETPQPPQV